MDVDDDEDFNIFENHSNQKDKSGDIDDDDEREFEQ
jgi:hypothetical protein